MANGKFTISMGAAGTPNYAFIGFDSDETGAPCTEATNANSLGRKLTEAESTRFVSLPSGMKMHIKGLDYSVEWRK